MNPVILLDKGMGVYNSTYDPSNLADWIYIFFSEQGKELMAILFTQRNLNIIIIITIQSCNLSALLYNMLLTTLLTVYPAVLHCHLLFRLRFGISNLSFSPDKIAVSCLWCLLFSRKDEFHCDFSYSLVSATYSLYNM